LALIIDEGMRLVCNTICLLHLLELGGSARARRLRGKAPNAVHTASLRLYQRRGIPRRGIPRRGSSAGMVVIGASIVRVLAEGVAGVAGVAGRRSRHGNQSLKLNISTSQLLLYLAR
jgi:hypothetical protein